MNVDRPDVTDPDVTDPDVTDPDMVDSDMVDSDTTSSSDAMSDSSDTTSDSDSDSDNTTSESDTSDRPKRDPADRRKDASFELVSVGEGPEQHLRFEDLWFDDGDVVLVADKLRLKVHRASLAQYSNVFRDMFQIADASGASGSVADCPVVNVTDNPQDLISFIQILCGGEQQYAHSFFFNYLC